MRVIRPKWNWAHCLAGSGEIQKISILGFALRNKRTFSKWLKVTEMNPNKMKWLWSVKTTDPSFPFHFLKRLGWDSISSAWIFDLATRSSLLSICNVFKVSRRYRPTQYILYNCTYMYYEIHKSRKFSFSSHGPLIYNSEVHVSSIWRK